MPLIPLMPTIAGGGISTKLPIKKMSKKLTKNDDSKTRINGDVLTSLDEIKKIPIFETSTTSIDGGELPFEPMVDLQTIRISAPTSFTIRVNFFFKKHNCFGAKVEF